MRTRGRYFTRTVGALVRAEASRPVGYASLGKHPPEYRLTKSRVRILRGHRLVSKLDVPYSDSSEGIVAGDFSLVIFSLSYNQ